MPEPRLLVVSPFDKGAMAAIEKAISNADLGLNPSNDGVVIRLTFPALTEERRKAFVKIVTTKAEEGKVALRGVRRHARQELETLEKDQGLSERRHRAPREGPRQDDPGRGGRRSTRCSRTRSRNYLRSDDDDLSTSPPAKCRW